MFMRNDSRQQPLFRVSQFLNKPYPPGSIYDVIARYGRFLFDRRDFPEADPRLGGRLGWCPVQLSALEVLRQKHSWSDAETVRRATVDLSVKACLGMGIEQRGPNQATLSRHRTLMQELGLDEVYLERLRDLLEALELVGDDEAVLIDSVPIDGGGQELDTYNLLAGATLRGLRELAKRQERSVQDVASELGLAVYLDRSVKGRFDVDWEDEESRCGFLARLVEDARRVRDLLAAPTPSVSNPPGFPESMDGEDDEDGSGGNDDGELGAADIIDSIIEHDVEFGEDDSVKGIRQRPAGDRIISVTDSDMRHGRKSASKIIAGYKAQIIASLLFGFIVLTRVIRANVHDGHDLPDIVLELEERGLRPAWWGADHAYGTLANHKFFDDPERGELIARMPRPANGGRFTKDEFIYSFDTNRLTCPAGHEIGQTRWATQRKGQKGRVFQFPAEMCRGCPLLAQCVNPKAAPSKGRSVLIIDAQERLIRDHLSRRTTPEFREKLSKRPVVERVIGGFAQCGGKNTRRRGKKAVAFDANISALAYNLRRLGSLLNTDEQLAEKLAAVLRAFARLLRATMGRLIAALTALRTAQPPKSMQCHMS